jgi:hypothetical protein
MPSPNPPPPYFPFPPSLLFSMFDTLVITVKFSDLPCSNSEVKYRISYLDAVASEKQLLTSTVLLLTLKGVACANCVGGEGLLCLMNRFSIHVRQRIQEYDNVLRIPYSFQRPALCP